MDAPAAESDLQTARRGWLGWLARERASGRFYRWATFGTLILFAGILVGSFMVIGRSGEPGSLLSPPLIALLLIANLLPASA